MPIEEQAAQLEVNQPTPPPLSFRTKLIYIDKVNEIIFTVAPPQMTQPGVLQLACAGRLVVIPLIQLRRWETEQLFDGPKIITGMEEK